MKVRASHFFLLAMAAIAFCNASSTNIAKKSLLQKTKIFMGNHKKKLIATGVCIGLHYYFKFRHANKIAASEAAVKGLHDLDFIRETNEFARSLKMQYPTVDGPYFLTPLDQDLEDMFNSAEILKVNPNAMSNQEIEALYQKLQLQDPEQEVPVEDRRGFVMGKMKVWRKEQEQFQKDKAYYRYKPYDELLYYYSRFVTTFKLSENECVRENERLLESLKRRISGRQANDNEQELIKKLEALMALRTKNLHYNQAQQRARILIEDQPYPLYNYLFGNRTSLFGGQEDER